MIAIVTFFRQWLLLMVIIMVSFAALAMHFFLLVASPFTYEISNVGDTALCPGEVLRFDLTVTSYDSGIVQVVREWETDGYIQQHDARTTIVESNRHAWEFWVAPNKRTFPQAVQVPINAPSGELEFQQGAGGRLTEPQWFTIPITVPEDCD